jgi:hypothetical protein
MMLNIKLDFDAAQAIVVAALKDDIKMNQEMLDQCKFWHEEDALIAEKFVKKAQWLLDNYYGNGDE